MMTKETFTQYAGPVLSGALPVGAPTAVIKEGQHVTSDERSKRVAEQVVCGAKGLPAPGRSC